MKNIKQLNCHLYSKATEELQNSVCEDMEKEDGNLKELLDERSATEDTKKTGD